MAAESKNKADRWIIIGAVLILGAAISLLTFDDWLWGGHRSGGTAIGKIVSRDGDIRVKYAGDVRWQKASKGDTLLYNDTVFSGANSQVGLNLGSSTVNLGENSLVVIRQQNDAQFLALTYGSLTGKVHAGDKILIDAGDGKPVLLNAKADSEIALKKVNGKTELQLVKGRAELNNRAMTPAKKETLAAAPVPRPPPPPPPPPAPKRETAQLIRILKPKSSERIYSKDELTSDFEWSYGDKTQVDPKSQFTLEFSKTPGFEKLQAVRTVQGKTADMIRARRSLELYFRVRGPKNELSQPQLLSYVHMEPPVIVSPVDGAKFAATAKTPANIPVQFQPIPENPRYWMQIASDADFKTVLINESHPEAQNTQSLPSGGYFLRARTDYGDEHVSDWSKPVQFVVQEKSRAIVPHWAFQNSVLIPNKVYPEALYSSDKADVEAFLAKDGFLTDYFGTIKGAADEVVVDSMDGTTPKVTNFAWPTDRLEPKPAPYTYRYRVHKRGQLPSRWSPPEKLLISLEPPHGTQVDPHAGQLTKDGRIPVKVMFTPLLFAASYEVQLSQTPEMLNPKDTVVKKPQVGFYAIRKHVYYWRARALNEKGEPISAFSSVDKMNAGDFEPAILQAKREAAKQRQLASTPVNTSTASLEGNGSGMRTFESPGFWVWAGSGYNFVDYNQSIAGRGTYDSKSFQPMGAYVEMGWSDGHLGGVVTYKNTPGQLVSNVPVSNPDYSWQTLTAEGIYCPVKQTSVFGAPLLTGIRFGLQYQQMPFYFLNFNRNLVTGTADMLDASLGGMIEWSVNRWRYYTLLRYEYPFSSSGSNNGTFTPKFSFDGSIGTAYYLTQHFKTGLFWYGQWQQFGFSSSDATVTNSGSQMLFYSAFDLRLGYDF